MTPNTNYFDLFNLPQQYKINRSLLDSNYRDLQKSTHPDVFVNDSSAAQLQAVQQTANNTEAYQTLKSAIFRAVHLLNILGVEFDLNHYTVKDLDLLMQQMHYREQLDNIKSSQDLDGLNEFAEKIQSLIKETENLITDQFEDLSNNQIEIKNNICELQFLTKLSLDIEEIEEQLLFQD